MARDNAVGEYVRETEDELRGILPPSRTRLVLRQAQDEALGARCATGLILSLSKGEAVLTGLSISPTDPRLTNPIPSRPVTP